VNKGETLRNKTKPGVVRDKDAANEQGFKTGLIVQAGARASQCRPGQILLDLKRLMNCIGGVKRRACEKWVKAATVDWTWGMGDRGCWTTGDGNWSWDLGIPCTRL